MSDGGGVGRGGERGHRGCRAAAGAERVRTAREGAAMPGILVVPTVRRKGDCLPSETAIIDMRKRKNKVKAMPINKCCNIAIESAAALRQVITDPEKGLVS